MQTNPIRDLYAIVDERRWDELDRVFDPDAVYERPGYPPFVGLTHIRQFYEFERVIATGVHHVESAIALDKEGASRGVFIGAHRDGALLKELFAEFFRFRDGKIVSRTTYFFRAAI